MPFKTQASFANGSDAETSAYLMNNKPFKPTFVMPFAGQTVQ